VSPSTPKVERTPKESGEPSGSATEEVVKRKRRVTARMSTLPRVQVESKGSSEEDEGSSKARKDVAKGKRREVPVVADKAPAKVCNKSVRYSFQIY
jgi:hypothetical protein